MSQQQSVFDKSMALIDAANSEDPNQEAADGKDWPKELLYSHRMTDMLLRYTPDADDAMQAGDSCTAYSTLEIPS